MLIGEINTNTFTPGGFVKSVLLVQKDTSKVLLASNDVVALSGQNAVDQAIVNTTVLTPDQCQQTTFTKDELSGGLKQAVVGNEDVGRYVGYGRKEITKDGGLNIGYGLLRLFTLKDNICYSTNSQARLLCNNAQAIDSFNVPVLQRNYWYRKSC